MTAPATEPERAPCGCPLEQECLECGETKPLGEDGAYAGGDSWTSLVCARCEGGDPEKVDLYARGVREEQFDVESLLPDVLEGAAEALRDRDHRIAGLRERVEDLEARLEGLGRDPRP